MNDLVSVGGVCFVAVEPDAKGGADTQAHTDPHGPTRTDAEGKVPGDAAGGKRKYRPRGERSRKEQQRAASRHYYREYRVEILKKQQRHRQEHKEEVREYYRKYYAHYRQRRKEMR